MKVSFGNLFSISFFEKERSHYYHYPAEELRYGPRPINESKHFKMRAAVNYGENLRWQQDLIEKFNTSTDPQQRQAALLSLTEKRILTLPKVGKVLSENSIWKYFSFKKGKKVPRRMLKISEGQLIIKILTDEETREYQTKKLIPLSRITLELRGHDQKKWEESDLEIHVLIAEDPNKVSWSKSFLGY